MPSGPTTARCLPSPVTSKSGDGAEAAAAAPTSERGQPSSRTRVFHRHSHKPPTTIRPKAQPGMDGSSTTRRSPSDMMREAEQPSIAAPHSSHNGLPHPTGSNSKAPASSGMMTKVVRGIAMMFAPTP